MSSAIKNKITLNRLWEVAYRHEKQFPLLNHFVIGVAGFGRLKIHVLQIACIKYCKNLYLLC